MSKFEDKTSLKHLMERNSQPSTLIGYSLQHSFAIIEEALVTTTSSLDSTGSSSSATIEPFITRTSSTQQPLELSLHSEV